jgi:Spy/CpxP family protein refolding chaperone
MKKIVALAFAALLLGAGLVAWAHDPGGPGMMHGGMHGMHGMDGPITAEHVEFISRALDLTDEQKAAAKQIHQEVFAKAQPLFAQHRQQMEEVEALLDSANPDPAEVGRKAIAAHATHKQLEALHEDAFARFKALLTPDQLEKLNKLHERHGERHGPQDSEGPGV